MLNNEDLIKIYRCWGVPCDLSLTSPDPHANAMATSPGGAPTTNDKRTQMDDEKDSISNEFRRKIC